MKTLVQLAAVTAFVFIADYLWLGVIMKGFYQQELGPLMRRDAAGNFSPRIVAALLVYVLIPVGIVLFATPRSANGTVVEALGWGALFGLVVYGIYDLSNLAVLDKWTWRVTVADVLWGTCLCSSGAALGHLTANVFSRFRA